MLHFVQHDKKQIVNQINQLFQAKKKNILSIYFTAGFPKLEDTNIVLDQLVKSGVDMIEIGIPFSDPLADGPVIQHSSEVALENGMTLKLLFEQLSKSNLSNITQVPFILMGYLNPVLQFGVENFCKKANEVGISGVILPDLPMDEYLKEYKSIFDKYNLKNIFLITPQTSEKRIRYIDENTDGFIYLVASASTTGTNTGMDDEKVKYFSRIKNMNLKNPLMIGFGIGNKANFAKACEYTNGAIIGSAFIRAIGESMNLKNDINEFVMKLK
jgi:tryptophan synthase alpha chain